MTERSIEKSEAEEALRKERDKIQKYLNIAEVILIVIDSQQKVSLINKKGCEILGYSEEDILGQNWFDRFVPTSVRENVRAGFFKLMNGEMPFMEYFENSVLTKSGEERLIAWHNSILTDHSDRISGTLSSGQDITKRKLAEEKLQQTMRELKRSNAELEQFAYVTSHDLQQPLLMIECYAQLLTQRYTGQFDAEADSFIARIQEGVEDMQHMIRDLLDYSRMDAKRAELQPIESELLLHKALDNLHTVIEEQQAAISSTPLPTILAVEVQFVQLFQNLVGNAIKFQSDASPRIHVSVEQGENEWIFSVQDNGIGIAAEDVERIFTIFERLHSRSKYPGTGIGLAICKKIVERHGGRIWVESQPGEGSTFYFTSPMNA